MAITPVFVVVGPLAAGKTLLCDHLVREWGATRLSDDDFFREELARLGLPDTHEHIDAIATIFGDAKFLGSAKQAAEHIQAIEAGQLKARMIAYDGLRFEAPIRLLKVRMEDCKVLFVDANLDVRSHRAWREQTWLRGIHGLAGINQLPTHQNVGRLRDSVVDHVIENHGDDPKAFLDQADRLLEDTYFLEKPTRLETAE